YLTIEHKGPVDAELRPLLGNRIYGCDDCLAVCPWNKFAVAAGEVKYAARPDLVAPPLAELATLDDASFRARFSGSPVKRIGVARFLRNVLYAIGNSGDPALAPVAAVCDDRELRVTLADGATVATPLWWYPRLLTATPAQRAAVELTAFGVHWPELDEDLSVEGMLKGWKAKGATPPAGPESG
ncbi:MAG: DUF2442 domain-containing protein, partial [Roseinatronobacter sp.]